MSDQDDRIDRLEDRLRQVLALLSNAPTSYTTISDSQGSFQGHDRFISPELRTEAAELLEEWDEEDASSPVPAEASATPKRPTPEQPHDR